ncbi:MAG: heparan-alpha-glucosaminide N-acetyltransferase [Candidatus Micrarchaeota archaeon]
MARIIEVDALRGVAIILMVIYHVIFDINYFGIAQIDIYSLPVVLFQRTIGSLFLLLVGVSLTLSDRGNKEGYSRHLKRAGMLAAAALGITLATWIYPHDGFITFGIIHFIAFAAAAGPLFLRFGRLNLLLGILAILAGLMAGGIEVEQGYLFWLGLADAGYTALDYYPVLPWFGVVLIGIYAGEALFPRGVARVRIAPSKPAEALAFLGRNSLLAYLIHQPVIIGILMVLMALGIV